jgi:hypothetical protein
MEAPKQVYCKNLQKGIEGVDECSNHLFDKKRISHSHTPCKKTTYAEVEPTRKANSDMETNTDGTFFQEGDYIRIKRTGKQGKVNATDGGVVYVVMDETKEAKIFSAAVDEDAFIELAPTEAKA